MKPSRLPESWFFEKSDEHSEASDSACNGWGYNSDNSNARASGNGREYEEDRPNGNGWSLGNCAGEGSFAGAGKVTKSIVDGEGYSLPSGNGHAFHAYFLFSDFCLPQEMHPLFYPWTPEKILHAYAYMTASTKKEKDCILGLVEMAKEKA